MKRPCAILAILFLTTSIAGVEKKPFALDDLYRIKSIGSLKLSPDGTKLLFSVTSYDSVAADTKTHLYQLNLTTNELRQLTFHDQGDFNPFWSPNGMNIYFLSTRESGVQLWSLPSLGGEATKLTSFYTGIFSPQISRDGKKIVFNLLYGMYGDLLYWEGGLAKALQLRGHDVKALRTPSVGELFRRGCAWAAGKDVLPHSRQAR